MNLIYMVTVTWWYGQHAHVERPGQPYTTSRGGCSSWVMGVTEYSIFMRDHPYHCIPILRGPIYCVFNWSSICFHDPHFDCETLFWRIFLRMWGVKVSQARSILGRVSFFPRNILASTTSTRSENTQFANAKTNMVNIWFLMNN